MPDPLLTLLIGSAVIAILLLLSWPDNGLLARWQRLRRSTGRVLNEDALKHMFETEIRGRRATPQSVSGALRVPVSRAVALLGDMEQRELIAVVGDELQLTPSGRRAALHVIRAHRLWERHLAEDTGFVETEWHELAERREHEMSPPEADRLAARLGYPTRDPHGDPIPTSRGEMVLNGGRPLTAMPPNVAASIVHIEDEPETVYAQLVAEGLYPGMCVRLIEATSQRVRFWANGDEHVLAPIVAANLSVVPVEQAVEVDDRGGVPLHQLRLGESGEVVRISPRCRGAERRRLLDLGIVPGTRIGAEMVSPAGDPTAYRVRGALVAFRREQADFIRVTQVSETTS